MRKMMIAIAALGVAVTAAPAMAQGYGDRGGWQGQRGDRYERGDIQQIGQRIERLAGTRQISPREAMGLRRDYRYLVQLERRYQHNGLNRAERNDLDRRTDALQRRLRYERNDGNGYNGRDDRRDDRGWNDRRH